MKRPAGAPRSLYDGSHKPPVAVVDRQTKRERGKKNIYVCGTCHGAIATVDVDEGVTPMFLSCRASGTCDGTMQSQMYPAEPWGAAVTVMIAAGSGADLHMEEHRIYTPDVTFEWYRPTRSEARGTSRAVREHVRDGGLLLREIPSQVGTIAEGAE